VYIGSLNINTGSINFYGSSILSYSAGPISSGSDGKIYYAFKDANSGNTYLLSFDPSTSMSAIVRTYNTYANIKSLTNGPDGRLWATDMYFGYVYAESLTGGTNAIYSGVVGTAPVGAPSGIISGPDGNVWFVSQGKISKMTTSGVRTDYSMPSGVAPGKLTAGSDGAVWFADVQSSAPKIGRITTSGTVTEYSIPGTNVSYQIGGPVLGPDDAIWFNYRINNPAAYKVGRLGY